MDMVQITNTLPGIIAIHDICIDGKTREHAAYLLQLMKTPSNNGLIFKSQMQHITTTNHILWSNIYSNQDETRPSKSTSLTGPPHSIKSKTTTIICRLHQLSTAFLSDLAAKTTFL